MNQKYFSIDSIIEPGNSYYYRLTAEAFDGTINTYLNSLVRVEVPKAENFFIKPNYNQNLDYVLLENRIIIKTSIQIPNQLTLISLEGKTINPKVDIIHDSYYSIDLSNLPEGKYILINNRNLICKFIK